MNYKRTFTLAALVAVLATTVRADELADKARDIFKKNQAAVVTVQAVLNVTVAGQGRANETKAEITGVVVDPSGLTAVALSSIDPSSMAEQAGYKIEIEVNEVKILLDDGAEVPAEIVLRDKDRDLGFIRPKAKPAAPMTAVDLAKAGTAQVVDEILTITRLGKAAGRAHAASVERVAAVVQKPRLFYIPDSTMTATRQGSPAFTMDGKVLGVFVFRSITSKGSGNARDNVTSIILPAEDIAKAAKQAPEAKGDSEKKEPAKEAAKEPVKETKPADPK